VAHANETQTDTGVNTDKDCDVIVGFMVRKGTGGTAAARAWSVSHAQQPSVVGMPARAPTAASDAILSETTPTATRENPAPPPVNTVESTTAAAAAACDNTGDSVSGPTAGHGVSDEITSQGDGPTSRSVAHATVDKVNAKFIKFTFSVRMEVYVRQKLWDRLGTIPGRQT
jgi:hypothetical protein